MKFELSEHTSDDDSQTFQFETTLEDLEIAEVDHDAEDEESVRVVFGIERTKKGDWVEVLWVEAERDGDWTLCSHVFRTTEVVEILQELEDVNDEYDGLILTLEDLQETPTDNDDDF